MAQFFCQCEIESTGTIEAAVSEILLQSVVLGMDVPVSLIKVKEALMVVTRSQAQM